MIKIFITITAIIILSVSAYSQDYIFFSDSPNSSYYDPSWGFANSPSFLERVNGSKFPVSTTYYYSGLNSLKLKWISQTGGDWGMAVASEGWIGRNVLLKDSISLYIYTTNAFLSADFPLMYIEDLNNTKTPKQNVGVYVGDIVANTWKRVFIPLSIFKNNPGSANLTQIKTIFWGQSNADGIERTLYFDEIRMISSAVIDTVRPSVPIGITTRGFENHIDIKWDPNTEPDLKGYYLYKFQNTVFTRISSTPKEIPFFTDFLGGYGVTGVYKISAFDSSGNESFLSNELTATTNQMNDEDLLTMLQEATFRYFWDYAHPVSGLARERLGSGETVTIGGSGFGIMAIPVGIERGFITREQGVQRMLKILNFLQNTADRFHGAWSHWLNGTTGDVIPFSTYDNGGDLVETAFMIQGLLAVRQYFNSNSADEIQIRNLITNLWESVEWDWYRRFPTSNFLYWHWSPNYNWQMNMIVRGPNETQIVYLLAIASPTHGVPASLYQNGYTSSPSYLNGNVYYGYKIYVGWPYGGPLFFTHYSFLGFDPRDKKDAYANYFLNSRNITLINRAYCIANPMGHQGYGINCWGLTASDDPFGYSVHEPIPSRDNGTITPTAALSSMPYTPQESIDAFKHLYHTYGNKIWGSFGFKDAFNVSQNWYANSYLAIDQGPIIVMVENYRSGLLWNKFMANPEIQPMLNAIGFVPDSTTNIVEDVSKDYSFKLLGNYPNPFNPSTSIRFELPSNQRVKVNIYNVLGENVKELFGGELTAGMNELVWNGSNDLGDICQSGIYLYRIESGGNVLSGKMIFQK
jgi:hypothetical protein